MGFGLLSATSLKAHYKDTKNILMVAKSTIFLATKIVTTGL